jgi:hypothetical protein
MLLYGSEARTAKGKVQRGFRRQVIGEVLYTQLWTR